MRVVAGQEFERRSWGAEYRTLIRIQKGWSGARDSNSGPHGPETCGGGHLRAGLGREAA
jgi:hypothetical protein